MNNNFLLGTIIVGAIIIMAIGLWIVYNRLKEKGQGFGANSLQALALVLFIPTLLILAVTGSFATETLAVLFGTLAGYLFSNKEDNPKS